MFARLSNSWELVKASYAVLKADKELVIFPIISGIGVLIVSATFAVPMLLAGIFDKLAAGQSESVGILAAIVGFLFYVVMYTVIFFANSALVGAALIRLEGRDPTLADGLRIAREHIGSILGYAVIAATVGMVLRALSERAGLLGRIVVSIIGFVWNIATFLVVPILVVEGIGPVDAVKRSASLLRQTWGEQLVGNFSIGMIFFLLFLGVFALGVPAIIIAASLHSALLIFLAVGGMILAFMILGLLNSTLNGIYTAAVYRYAVTGEVSSYFDQELISGAFKAKRG